MQFYLKQAFHLLLLLALAFFLYLMGEITLRYLPYSTTASFLQIKQTEVTSLPYYLPVFYIHVYTSIFCLLAGFTQFNSTLQSKHKKIHRTAGYGYILTVLLFSAPTGFIMGLHANGGGLAIAFFVVLAGLWWWCTYQAIAAARTKNFVAHRNWMIRSYALALSAITLRLWKVILVYFFHPAPMDLYVVIAGLGWIPNLMIAEFIIYKYKQK